MAKSFNNKSISMDDGFKPELIRNASLDGKFEIPSINKNEEIRIPDYLIPYSKLGYCSKENVFCCFYEMDANFSDVISDPEDERIIEKLRKCSGVITPDCSVDINAPICVQMLNIYRSRAIGSLLQSLGIYTVVNARWGCRATYTTDVFPEPIAFLGIPKESIVSIGSYGAMKNRELKKHFREGLVEMVRYVKPKVVLVYGPMPEDVFGDLTEHVTFIQFDDWTRLRHGGQL